MKNSKISKLSDITVAILAGGLGKRLRSKVFDRPKLLAEVGNTPFLQKLLDQLDSAGFKNIMLCIGYLGNQIKEKFCNHYRNLDLLYSQEHIPLGTGGALRLTLPLLESENVLVMNGDSFCDVDFEKFWQFHVSKNSKASLVVTSVSDASRFGQVKLRGDHRIIGFEEKNEQKKAGLINAGIYLIDKNLIKEIPQKKLVSIEKDVFPNWIGKAFYGYRCNHNFIDIGTPESYAQAEQFFAQY